MKDTKVNKMKTIVIVFLATFGFNFDKTFSGAPSGHEKRTIRDSDGITYRTLGSTFRDNNENFCRLVGSSLRCNNKITYRKVGSTIRGSDNSSCRMVGSTFRCEDGTTYRKVGNTFRGNNGHTFRFIN